MSFQKQTGEDCEVMRNKDPLVAQGFSQVEGLDFGETFAPVARFEVIKWMWKVISYMVPYKKKSMLGNPQVSRIPSILIERTSSQKLYTGLSKCRGHARLQILLLDHGYVMGSIDKTFFTLKHGIDFLLVQIYVDDIIFGGSSHVLVSNF
jgi:hypothetical protein